MPLAGKETEEFLKAAKEEFHRALSDGDPLKFRDAAEKAWNATLQATDYLLEKKGFPQPKSHFERRKDLLELSEKDEKAKELGLKDRYMAREQTLHEYCFYEGIFSLGIIEEEFEKVEKYIEDVMRL